MTDVPAPVAAEAGQSTTVSRAMWRGFRCRCPHCGEGRLFRGFLKVADHCPACGEELHHHRADDFPAYIVIVIVGHILVPLVYSVEVHFDPPFWFGMVFWPLAVIALGLALLPPVKGAIVGLQWALRMHGFEESRKRRSAGESSLQPAAADA